MKTVGSQTRERIEDTEYELVSIDEHTVINEHGSHKAEYPQSREAILEVTDTGKQELWVESDDFAGYVIEIDGIGYEFIRSLE